MSIKTIAILALIGAAAVVGILVVSGPDRSGPSSKGAEKVVIFARSGDSHGLDPQETEWGEDALVMDNLYETLVRFKDGGAELEPGLADSWSVQDGGRVWEFALRQNVYFHDGTLFTADAVVFSFDRLLKDVKDNPHSPVTRPYASMYEDIQVVEKIEQYKVRFVLKGPSAVFLKNAAMFPASIVSPVAVKSKGEKFVSEPVGTGPMKFVRWEKNIKLEIARNDGYWGKELPGRPARVDRIIFLPVKDAQVRVEKLRSGDAHIINNIGLADVIALQKDPKIALSFAPAMNICYLGFNMKLPPYNDRNFRQAVAHAVSLPKVVEKGYHGLADQAASIVPPSIWTGDGSAPKYEHNLDKARELLKKVRLGSGEIVIWHPDFSRPYVPEPANVAIALKDDLGQLGLKVRIESLPIDAFRAKIRGEDHPMFILGWSTDNADPDNFFFALLHAASIGGNNNSLFDHPKFNEVVKKAQQEVDPAKRRDLYNQAEKIFKEELPVLPLVHVRQAVAFSKNIRFRMHPIETRAYQIEIAAEETK